MSRPRLSRRSMKRALPMVAVAAVVLMIVFTQLGNASRPDEAFTFRAYWPNPGTYVPGTIPPSAYLEINYTGPSRGNFTYIITYNSTLGQVVAGKGTALVSPLAPFTTYLFLPSATPHSVFIVHAEVYRGPPVPGNLVFAQSLIF